MYFRKKSFKRILKNKRSPGAWENLELQLQLQGKHGSRMLWLPAHNHKNHYFIIGKLFNNSYVTRK